MTGFSDVEGSLILSCDKPLDFRAVILLQSSSTL